MTVDFVCDLDHVMVDYCHPAPEELARGDPFIFAQGAYYRVARGASDFLESLARIPGARVSFYSRGPQEKVNDMVAGLRMPSGATAADMAHAILSNSQILDAETGIPVCEEFAKDATTRPRQCLQPPATVFLGRRKKDLRRVPDVDLARTVLIDDKAENVTIGQERNLLWLQNTDGHSRRGPFQSPDGILAAAARIQSAAVDRRESLAYFTDRNRLAYARGLIDAALRRADDCGCELADALWSIQWRGYISMPQFDSEIRTTMKYYRTGMRLLKSVNPALRTASLFEHDGG